MFVCCFFYYKYGRQTTYLVISGATYLWTLNVLLWCQFSTQCQNKFKTVPKVTPKRQLAWIPIVADGKTTLNAIAMLSLHKLCHSAYAAGLDCDCGRRHLMLSMYASDMIQLQIQTTAHSNRSYLNNLYGLLTDSEKKNYHIMILFPYWRIGIISKFYLGCIVERLQWAAQVPMCEPTTAVEGMSPIDWLLSSFIL